MKYSLLILFFFTNLVIAQSGIINYDIKVEQQIVTNAHQEADNFIDKMADYANKQKFELTFNKKKSSFKHIQQLSTNTDFDNKMENIAKAAFTSSDVYIDYEIKSEIYVKNDGVLVENKYNAAKWETTTESKVISNYLCYKAILKIPLINRYKENIIQEITAWFAPSLPYSYGPKNYHGLPGLILELMENKTTFLAAKIVLLDKDITIDFPKGKTVTKEDYEKKLKAQMGM
jgi:GLPGLI family protein